MFLTSLSEEQYLEMMVSSSGHDYWSSISEGLVSVMSDDLTLLKRFVEIGGKRYGRVVGDGWFCSIGAPGVINLNDIPMDRLKRIATTGDIEIKWSSNQNTFFIVDL